jgi:hypothetical protein
VLGYHACDRDVDERLLRGTPFRPSDNEYDWLGPGIYFWETNPLRGLEFAIEAAEREPTRIRKPFVVGAITELGFCLDLATKAGIEMVRSAYESLAETRRAANVQLLGEQFGQAQTSVGLHCNSPSTQTKKPRARSLI